ncbi:unnamed protein product, partial [Symbiodinium sp. CCMP2456]
EESEPVRPWYHRLLTCACCPIRVCLKGVALLLRLSCAAILLPFHLISKVIIYFVVERLQALTLFLAHVVFLTSVLHDDAKTGALNSETGAPWATWQFLLLTASAWLLLQAFLRVGLSENDPGLSGLDFLQCYVFYVAPGIGAGFDLSKDIILAALCANSSFHFVQGMGYLCYFWLVAMHCVRMVYSTKAKDEACSVYGGLLYLNTSTTLRFATRLRFLSARLFTKQEWRVMVAKENVALVAAASLALSEKRVNGKVFTLLWNIGVPLFKLVAGFVSSRFDDESEPEEALAKSTAAELEEAEQPGTSEGPRDQAA